MNTKPIFFEKFLLAAILVIALIARYYGLDRQSLWIDELFGIWASYSSSFRELIPILKADSHPPGYLTFLYFYRPLFDSSELQLRLSSLLAGLGVVYATYLLGSRYFSMATGIIAAALVSVNYQSIYYSQELRAYTMLSLACLLSLYFFIALVIYKNESRRVTIPFVVSSILAVYLHYAGFIFVGCEFIVFIAIHMMTKKSWVAWFKVLIPFICIGILYLPWLGTMFQHMTGFKDYWGGANKPNLASLEYLFSLLFGPPALALNIILGGSLLCTLFALIARVGRMQKLVSMQNASAILIIAIMSVAPIMVFFLKSQFGQAIFQERHFIYTIPLFYIMACYLLTAPIDLIKNNIFRGAILTVATTAIIIFQTDLNLKAGLYRIYTKDPIREAFQVVTADKSFMSETDPQAFMSHRQMYYYMQKAGFNITYDIGSSGQYYELRHSLVTHPGFYYVTITPPQESPFIAASLEDFDMYCRRDLNTRSGTVSVVKMTLRSRQPVTEIRECAPELALQFPIQ